MAGRAADAATAAAVVLAGLTWADVSAIAAVVASFAATSASMGALYYYLKKANTKD